MEEMAKWSRDKEYWAIHSYGVEDVPIFCPKPVRYIGCHPEYPNRHYFDNGYILDSKKHINKTVFESRKKCEDKIRKLLKKQIKVGA